MGIIQFFFICLVIGLFVWAIHAYTPIPQQFKQLILWAGIIVCVLILASALGLFGWDTPIPRIGR